MELTTFLAVCLVIAAALVLHHQRALKKARDIVAECVKRADELSESYQRTIHSLRKDNSNLTRQVKELQAELARAKENERSWIPRDVPEPPTTGFGRATRPVPSAPLPASVQSNVVYSSGGGGSNVDIVTPAAVAMAFSSIVSEPVCDTSSSSGSSYDSGSSCSSSDSGSGGW